MNARFACPSCGHIYDERLGDPHQGFAPGTTWDRIPDDWDCPDCAVRAKADFRPIADGAESSGATAAAPPGTSTRQHA